MGPRCPLDELSRTEKAALLHFITFPSLSDTELSSRMGMANSTLASIKSRLRQMGYLNEHYIPNFPMLGLELLAAVYSDFNPSISVEERVANTRRTVEIYPEVVLSVGESHRGFSISVAENITRIMRISSERLKTLSDMDLLELELPQEVYFPFEMARVFRFFNLAPLLRSKLSRSDPTLLEEFGTTREDVCTRDRIMDTRGKGSMVRPAEVDLTSKQLEILYRTLRHPDLSASRLSEMTGHSRHTISRTRDMLVDEGFITLLRVPDLSKLDSVILSLYHVKLDPRNAMPISTEPDLDLLQEDSVFFVSRPHEIIMLAIYDNYMHHNHCKNLFNQYLKGNNMIKTIPTIRNHSLAEAIWIKRFETHELIKGTFGLK
jgi:DNA-binding MarR family transcriptional regulator